MDTMSTTGLPGDWYIAPGFDLELKQYVLLGHLQRIRSRFGERKLYPHLEELKVRLEELLRLSGQRRAMGGLFQGDITGLDLKRGRLVRAAIDELEQLRVIDEVVDFAIPALRDMLEEGSGLREELVSRIHFGPVGLLPLRPHEGYLVLRQGTEARLYGYSLWLVRGVDPELRYHSIRTCFIGSRSMGPVSTYAEVRSELLHAHRHLPNPAVFAFEADVTLPAIETYLPLAKQLVFDALERTAA